MTRAPASRNDAASRWVRIWRPTLDRVDTILVMWRARRRRKPAAQNAQQAAEATNEILPGPARLDRPAALDELATESRRALDERDAVRVFTGTEISEVPRGERTVG